MKVCAGVILYNPSQKFCDYVRHYISAVKTLIIYDNSSKDIMEYNYGELKKRFSDKFIFIGGGEIKEPRLQLMLSSTQR